MANKPNKDAKNSKNNKVVPKDDNKDSKNSSKDKVTSKYKGKLLNNEAKDSIGYNTRGEDMDSILSKPLKDETQDSLPYNTKGEDMDSLLFNPKPLDKEIEDSIFPFPSPKSLEKDSNNLIPSYDEMPVEKINSILNGENTYPYGNSYEDEYGYDYEYEDENYPECDDDEDYNYEYEYNEDCSYDYELEDGYNLGIGSLDFPRYPYTNKEQAILSDSFFHTLETKLGLLDIHYNHKSNSVQKELYAVADELEKRVKELENIASHTENWEYVRKYESILESLRTVIINQKELRKSMYNFCKEVTYNLQNNKI